MPLVGKSIRLVAKPHSAISKKASSVGNPTSFRVKTKNMVKSIQGRFYVGARGTCPPDSLVAPGFKP